MRKGFSLLELIVALGVIAVILGLGISGLVSFKSTVELQNVYSQIISEIKTQQNKAKNSVSSDTTLLPYIYYIFFKENSFTTGTCQNVNNVCFPLSDSNYTNFSSDQVNFKTLDNNCYGLGLLRLPSQNLQSDPIVAINKSGIYTNRNNSTEKCVYTLIHNQSGFTKTITVYLKKGTIDIL